MISQFLFIAYVLPCALLTRKREKETICGEQTRTLQGQIVSVGYK